MRREMGKKEEGRMVEKDGIDMWFPHLEGILVYMMMENMTVMA
jgi:hypothetical protein